LKKLTGSKDNILKWWGDALYTNRYYLLLLALALMIVVPAFIPERDESLVWTLSRTLVILAVLVGKFIGESGRER
jgi:hypothetical protein